MRNDNGFAAGRTIDFGAGARAINRQFLFALGTVENSIHKQPFVSSPSPLSSPTGSREGEHGLVREKIHGQKNKCLRGTRPVKTLLVSLFELFDARPNRGGGRGAFSYGGKDAFGFSGVFARDRHAIIQLNPGLARVVDGAVVSLEPLSQAGSALPLGRLQRRLQRLGEARQLRWVNYRRCRLFAGGLLFVLYLVPIQVQMPAAEKDRREDQGSAEFGHDSSTRSMRAPSWRSLPSMFS